MRYSTLLISVLTLATMMVNGQDCDQSQAFEIFHGNDIRTIVSNGGDLFWDLENNTFQVPFTGPETPSMIFAAGVWLGGIDESGTLRLAAQQFRYNQRNDYAPGPLDMQGSTEAATCAQWDQIWKVVRRDVLRHIQDFAADQVIDDRLDAIYAWPGAGNAHFAVYNGFEMPDLPHLSAPFHDINGNGLYEPDAGEYPLPAGVDPASIPMVMTWSVFNDVGAEHTNSHGLPLGAEFQLTTYAFACDGDARLNQTIFTSYRIVNRSGSSLDSLIFGQWMDPDLGCHTDDYFGSYPDGQSAFVYNTDPVDGTNGDICSHGIQTYGDDPPVLSVTFLDRPMTALSYWFNSGFWDGPRGMIEPDQPDEYYHLLNGRWRDGTPISAQGTGYLPIPEDVTTFAFYDDPNDPDGWSMYSIDFPLSDRRFVASSQLGRLEPGEAASVTLAFGYHLDSTLNHVENVGPMYDDVHDLHALYAAGFTGMCTYDTTDCTDDCVYPGDADHDGRVTLRDALNVAVALGKTGAERNAPLAWLPHTVADWAESGIGSVNAKHADTDGNGRVEVADLTYVEFYYDHVSPDYEPQPAEFGDDLQVLPEQQIIEPGENFFKVDVILDNPLVDSLYGLAYSLRYDPAYFEQFVPSWPGVPLQGDSLFNANRVSPGLIECAITGLDLVDRQVSQGMLMKLVGFAAEVAVSPDGDTTWISIENVLAVRKDGTQVPLRGQRVPVLVRDVVSVATAPDQSQISVFPNPSSGEINIITALDGPWSYLVTDSYGRLIDTGRSTESGTILHLSPGLYFIEVAGKASTVRQKVIVTQD